MKNGRPRTACVAGHGLRRPRLAKPRRLAVHHELGPRQRELHRDGVRAQLLVVEEAVVRHDERLAVARRLQHVEVGRFAARAHRVARTPRRDVHAARAQFVLDLGATTTRGGAVDEDLDRQVGPPAVEPLLREVEPEGRAPAAAGDDVGTVEHDAAQGRRDRQGAKAFASGHGRSVPRRGHFANGNSTRSGVVPTVNVAVACPSPDTVARIE
jgi:hypothetical protein